MNKKTNTVLFVLGATVFNLLLMAILFFVPLVLLSLVFGEKLAGVFGVLSIVLFFAALVGSFFVYGWVMKRISARVDMDRYFEPIFKKRNKP